MIFMICINALLSTALCIIIVACWRERNKSVAKSNSLQQRNEQLINTTEELAKEKDSLLRSVSELTLQNQVLQHKHRVMQVLEEKKNLYIINLLERNRSYMVGVDDYRKTMLKYAKSNTIDDIVRRLKDDDNIKEKEERFYHDFDVAFMDLHPDFVKHFNEMFAEDARIEPKSNELMTTELRIFALMRMGINDPVKIANFLNCSMTTIYNYRSRIKNKSIYNKEEFDKHLMEC